MPTRAEAPARALARLYTPRAQQEIFGLLLAIESQVRLCLAPQLEHQVAHARLAWWHEEAERLAQLRPEHPLTRALLAALAPQTPAAHTSVAGFAQLARWDLAAATFQSRRELEVYCRRWSAAALGPLAQLAFGDAAHPATLALGASLHGLELLNELPLAARRGRLRLPLDELTQAGVASAELAAAPFGAALSGLVRGAHQRAQGELAAAVAALAPHEQAGLRGVLVWASLAAAASRRAVAALPHAATPGDHAGLLDGWRAWRAGRRALRGHLRLGGAS